MLRHFFNSASHADRLQCLSKCGLFGIHCLLSQRLLPLKPCHCSYLSALFFVAVALQLRNGTLTLLSISAFLWCHMHSWLGRSPSVQSLELTCNADSCRKAKWELHQATCLERQQLGTRRWANCLRPSLWLLQESCKKPTRLGSGKCG